MMAGSTVVALSLLGFLVLLLKGRAVTKTSPVLMSLKALGIGVSLEIGKFCTLSCSVEWSTITPRSVIISSSPYVVRAAGLLSGQEICRIINTKFFN